MVAPEAVASEAVAVSTGLYDFFPTARAAFTGIVLILSGIGRHSVPEQWKIFVDGISSLGTFLGEKRYFMGDKVSEIDCTLFGMLVQFYYHDFEVKHKQYIDENFGNIVQYIERLRDEMWPDWRN